MSEWRFKRDTAFRKQIFVPESFVHPAKMDTQLLIRIVETYTEAGETIFDPMGGIGTTMLACMLGRNVIIVELEGKFCKICRDNWVEVKMRPQLGSGMGDCQIIQGDARHLEGLLVDKCIFSPPYAEAHDVKNLGVGDGDRADLRAYSWLKETNPNNIGNLKYGQIDKIVTSPPFGEAQSGGGIAKKGYQGDKHSPTDLVGKRTYMPENVGGKDNISRLPYGNIDSIITSSHTERHAYADATKERKAVEKLKAHSDSKIGEGSIHEHESDNPNNIGNLREQSYLEAMLQVYRECHKVLKLQGLMILVVKNFIRSKKEVDLKVDTIKLCEQAKFKFIEEHHHILSSQSFWRIIYKQKYPDAPEIDREYVLVFRKDE